MVITEQEQERDHVVRSYQNYPQIIDFYDNYYVPNRNNAANHNFIIFPRRTPSLGIHAPPYAALDFYLEQEYHGFLQHPYILNNIRNIVEELTNGDQDLCDYFFNNALGVFINPYNILTNSNPDEREVVRRYLDIAIRRRNGGGRRGINNN